MFSQFFLDILRYLAFTVQKLLKRVLKFFCICTAGSEEIPFQPIKRKPSLSSTNSSSMSSESLGIKSPISEGMREELETYRKQCQSQKEEVQYPSSEIHCILLVLCFSNEKSNEMFMWISLEVKKYFPYLSHFKCKDQSSMKIYFSWKLNQIMYMYI